MQKYATGDELLMASDKNNSKYNLSEEDEKLFRQAVPSQYNSEMYDSLKKDKRLERFLQALRICALKNMKIKQACDYLSKLFPSYVRGKGLTPSTLSRMILRYRDVEEAWGFSKDIALLLAFERGSTLVGITERMEDVLSFVTKFDTEELFTEKVNKSDKVETTVNIGNTYSKQTQNTSDLILSSLQALEDTDGSVSDDGSDEQETTTDD